MSDESDEGDRERIAELEQQVAQLQARLDQGQEMAEVDRWAATPPADTSPPEPEDPPQPSDPRDIRELEQVLPSRNRAIIIAVVAGLVALVAITAIILSLSSVIEPFSKSAAGALAPFADDQPPSKPPAKAAPDPLRVPGL